MTPEVLLIDADNFLYRSHFSHEHLTDENGRPTGILHGMLTGVLALHKRYPQAAQVFCWDSQRSWRYGLFPEYKRRARDPIVTDAVGQQRPLVQQVLQWYGFQQMQIASLEADDVIALLAHDLVGCPAPARRRILIYSGDRDFYQCIDDSNSVQVLKPTKKEPVIVTAQDIVKEFGVGPENYALFRALAGDPSDNYKAVRGVGPKTASAFIQAGAVPSYEAFAQHAPSRQHRIADLAPHWERVHLCWRLCVLPPKHAPVQAIKEYKRLAKPVLYNTGRALVEAPAKGIARRLLNDFYLDYDLAELHKRMDEFWRLP